MASQTKIGFRKRRKKHQRRMSRSGRRGKQTKGQKAAARERNLGIRR